MLEAETWGAFLLTFLLVELLGRLEARRDRRRAGRALLRLLTPLAKLTTGKQAVAAASEAIECFGGAGYVEDTGLPQLLRDAQVLPIWEGTTNVLSLDAAARSGLCTRASRRCWAGPRRPAHRATDRAARRRGTQADRRAGARGAVAGEPGRMPRCMQAGARRLAMTLARALQLALLCEHAQWMLDNGATARPRGGAALCAPAGRPDARGRSRTGGSLLLLD